MKKNVMRKFANVIITNWCVFITLRSIPFARLSGSPLPQARSSRDTGKSPSSLGLADFDLLRVIGRGSYAKVLLVQLKKTERIYAMKVVKKELVNDDEVNGNGDGGWWWHDLPMVVKVMLLLLLFLLTDKEGNIWLPFYISSLTLMVCERVKLKG